VEALDLALGLGVAGVAVLLPDAEVREQVLEAVAAADEPGRVHGPVVRERGRGPAVLLAGRGEGRDHVVAVHPAEHRAREEVAGVVVEPVRDLDLAAVGQPPVGEARLPDLVGRGRLEPDPEAPGPLVGLRHDEARPVEDPADGRDRRHREALVPEMPGDGCRARVEPPGGEADPEGDDPLPQLVGDGVRAGARAPGPGLQAVGALLAVPGEETLEVAPGQVALGCGGGDGQLP
jgi:hypothetical protein